MISNGKIVVSMNWLLFFAKDNAVDNVVMSFQVLDKLPRVQIPYSADSIVTPGDDSEN